MSLDAQNAFDFIWKIENYSFCTQTNGKYLVSPTFTASNISNTKLALSIHPEGCDENNNDYVACSLIVKGSGETSEAISVDCAVNMLKGDGTILKSINTTFDTNWMRNLRCRNFVTVEYLKNEMKSWKEDILTLHCHLSDNKTHRKHPTKGCNARTVIGVDRGTFEWDIRIPSFLKWSESVNLSFSDIPQFELSLSAPGEDVEINIQFGESALIESSVKLEITFIDKEGIDLDTKIESFSFHSPDNMSWNFPAFIKKEQLELDISGFKWYVFKVKGEVSTSRSTVTKIEHFVFSSPIVLEDVHTEQKLSKLQNNLRDLFISKKHSDIKLKTGNKDFYAHKSVLAAQSPVFSAMFDQEMVESRTGLVEISDVDSETLNTFLEYIYTDTVKKLDYEMARKVLLVADKYEVLPLKKKCASFLISDLSVDNVCEVSVTADMVNDDRLKKSAFKYVKAKAPEILSLPDWLLFVKNHSKLATEMLIMLFETVVAKNK